MKNSGTASLTGLAANAAPFAMRATSRFRIISNTCLSAECARRFRDGAAGLAAGPNCLQARQPYTLGVAGHYMASSPDLQQSLNATRADRSFFGHPRGLATLFFTEMWERFSYYGMRALLILFMTASVARGGLGFSYAKAGAIYGLYTGMVYLLSLPGG